MIYLFIILLQISIPTPDWPDLESPTPYMTTTPVPTATGFVTATSIVTNTPYPTDLATVQIPESALLDNLSTTESELDDLSSSIGTTDKQIYWNGNPILPNEDGSSVFGYFKWMTSTSAESLFGPFSPLLLHFGILMALVMLSLVIYFGKIIIVTLFKGVSWVVTNILKFIPFIG